MNTVIRCYRYYLIFPLFNMYHLERTEPAGFLIIKKEYNPDHELERTAAITVSVR